MGRRQLLAAVTALCLVQFTDVLGVTIVVTALPSMLASLHAPQSYSTIIATSYAMFFGGLLMLGARVGDRYGHRRTILASLALFAAGAAVTAAASSAIMLTAGRCLQGAAAAASVPSALRLLTAITAEGRERHRAIAAWSAAGAAAGASGFVAGGIITDLTNWRVVFWAYVPFAAVLGAVIAASVPSDAGGRRPESLNLAGSAALTAAVMAFVAGTTVIAQPGGHVAGALALAGCAALAVLFRLIDRRAAAPLLPGPLTSGQPLRQGALGGFLNTATTSSVITLVTLYLQNTLHRSPLDAATALVPFSLMAIAGSALSAAMQRRLRPQPVIAAGLAVIAAADALLIPLADQPWALPACAAAGGAGIGLSSVAATGLGTDVALRWRGAASGIINTTAQVGTAVGTAVLLLIAAATSGVPSSGHRTAGGRLGSRRRGRRGWRSLVRHRRLARSPSARHARAGRGRCPCGQGLVDLIARRRSACLRGRGARRACGRSISRVRQCARA